MTTLSLLTLWGACGQQSEMTVKGSPGNGGLTSWLTLEAYGGTGSPDPMRLQNLIVPPLRRPLFLLFFSRMFIHHISCTYCFNHCRYFHTLARRHDSSIPTLGMSNLPGSKSTLRRWTAIMRDVQTTWRDMPLCAVHSTIQERSPRQNRYSTRASG